VTRNLSPLIGTMQKHMPTLTRTATNPNPLAVSCKANRDRASIISGLPTRAQEFCSPSLQPSRRCKTHAFWPARTQPFRQIFIHSQIQLVYRDFTIKTN
jgi:hypothetical protein